MKDRSPAYPSVKSWDNASGKTGSGKKFCHSVISGADFATQPYDVAIATPVILLIELIWRLDLFMRLEAQSWCIFGGLRKRCGHQLLSGEELVANIMG